MKEKEKKKKKNVKTCNHFIVKKVLFFHLKPIDYHVWIKASNIEFFKMGFLFKNL